MQRDVFSEQFEVLRKSAASYLSHTSFQSGVEEDILDRREEDALSNTHKHEIDQHLGKTIEAYDEARQDKQAIEVNTKLGRVTSHIIDFNVRSEENQPTIFCLGGAISSAEADSQIGMVLAALGYRVVLLPHVLNGYTQHENPNFYEEFYSHEAKHENGDFSADGLIMERIIAAYCESRGINRNVHLFGFSAGAQVMLQTAKQISVQGWKNTIGSIHLLSPTGFYTPKQLSGNGKALIAAHITAHVALETVKARFDPTQWLLLMETGSGVNSRAEDLLRLAGRCASYSGLAIAQTLDIPIAIGLAREDTILDYRILDQNLTQYFGPGSYKSHTGYSPVVRYTLSPRELGHNDLLRNCFGVASIIRSTTDQLKEFPRN